MKRKRLSLSIAALLAVSGLWLAQSPWPMRALHKMSKIVGSKTPDGEPSPGQMLRPPDPNRKFRDLTPEQRVQLARQPHGVGG